MPASLAAGQLHLRQPMQTAMSDSPLDALVIGAGPCGLFQIFQLGLQGIACHVIEALPHAGGQCAELYPDKPIYDIPGIPHLLANDLTTQLLQQIEPFKPTFHYGQTVIELQQNESGFSVSTDAGNTLSAKNIILAAGAGAFTAVKMRVDGIDAFENKQLFYQLENADESKLRGKQVVVSGDTLSGIEAAIHMSTIAEHTTYVHRKRRLPTDEATLNRLHGSPEKLSVINGKITGFNTDNTKLTAITVLDANKEPRDVPADIILAKLGNSPKLHKFDSWGLNTSRNHVVVDPATSESNVDGIYVVGDINSYPGKRKLILCGFHEATLAAFNIAAQLSPDKPVHTQYTTTSTVLQQRLGVAS